MQSLERQIAKKFNRSCVDYQLLADGDKILVGLSGGKDSLMLLQLLAKRSRIYRPQIQVEAVHVVMDNVPYVTDTDFLTEFCTELGVRLNVLHTSFDEQTDKNKSKCFLCSWNRRKMMFTFATEQGFNKIALGHHQDDILTTLLMNMAFEGTVSTMQPLTQMEHYPISIIRPLCLVREEDIRKYATLAEWKQQTRSCPYEDLTMRHGMEETLQQMLRLNPEVRHNLWKSVNKLSNTNQ